MDTLYRTSSVHRRGSLVARLLAGSWRSEPPPATNFDPEDLVGVRPFVLASGSGPLAWWRIRIDPRLAGAPESAPLRDAFRHAVIDAAVRERRIAEVVSRLRSAGIEPMLFKGRAAATAYAEPATRPGGDIDLLLLPQDAAQAAGLLEEEVRLLVVDVDHEHLAPPEERVALFRRRSEVRIADARVTVPSSEDHLRLSCLHALSHGVARPVWLCDIAAWVESRPEGFDWSVTMSDDAETEERTKVALGLARRLLGMRAEGTPVEGWDGPPGWVASAVLRRWADPRWATPPQAWHTIAGLRPRIRALAMRWPPDPILDAIENGRGFTRWPRLPYQVADATRRIARTAARAEDG
jgi:hypothetical protein